MEKENDGNVKWSMQCTMDMGGITKMMMMNDDMNESKLKRRIKEIDVSEHVDALMKERVTFQKNLREKLQQYLKLQ